MLRIEFQQYIDQRHKKLCSRKPCMFCFSSSAYLITSFVASVPRSSCLARSIGSTKTSQNFICSLLLFAYIICCYREIQRLLVYVWTIGCIALFRSDAVDVVRICTVIRGKTTFHTQKIRQRRRKHRFPSSRDVIVPITYGCTFVHWYLFLNRCGLQQNIDHRFMVNCVAYSVRNLYPILSPPPPHRLNHQRFIMLHHLLPLLCKAKKQAKISVIDYSHCFQSYDDECTRHDSLTQCNKNCHYHQFIQAYKLITHANKRYWLRSKNEKNCTKILIGCTKTGDLELRSIY